MATYNTGIANIEYETEEELKILMAVYPNDDCPDDLPCPPPPIGSDYLSVRG